MLRLEGLFKKNKRGTQRSHFVKQRSSWCIIWRDSTGINRFRPLLLIAFWSRDWRLVSPLWWGLSMMGSWGFAKWRPLLFELTPPDGIQTTNGVNSRDLFGRWDTVGQAIYGLTPSWVVAIRDMSFFWWVLARTHTFTHCVFRGALITEGLHMALFLHCSQGNLMDCHGIKAAIWAENLTLKIIQMKMNGWCKAEWITATRFCRSRDAQ